METSEVVDHTLLVLLMAIPYVFLAFFLWIHHRK